MAVTADPDEIRRYGEMFKAIPAPGDPPRGVLLSGAGPLSAGLASAQNEKAFAAADFARVAERGIVAAGDGLVLISARLGDFDRQGAAGIRRILPDSAERVDG